MNPEDTLKYKIYRRLWYIWHCQLPRFKYFQQKTLVGTVKRLPNGEIVTGYTWERRHWVAVDHRSRPWWHICCNGDAGGWRTNLCDYLEGTFRAMERDYHDNQ